MKKTKEFLLLFVPCVVFAIIPMIISLVSVANSGSGFVGIGNYFRLFADDAVFLKAWLSVYFRAVVFFVLLVIVVRLIKKLFCFPKTRKAEYLVYLTLVALFTFVVGLIEDIKYSGSVTVTLNDAFLCLHTAFAVVLLFWVFESIFERIKTSRER